MEEDISELRKLQLEMFEMMKFFDKFCRDHNIKYSLCGGTLLGAIRHKGFIPWDDDVDFMLDRGNYNKLIKAFENVDLGKFEFKPDIAWFPKLIRKGDECCSKNFIWLDIFVYDKIPTNRFLARIKHLLVLLIVSMDLPGIGKHHPWYVRLCCNLCICLGKLSSRKQKYKWFDKVLQFADNKKTELLTCYQAILVNHGLLKQKMFIFDKYEDVEFEGYRFMSISAWNEYLTTQYGDYMILPPIEEQRPQISHLNMRSNV